MSDPLYTGCRIRAVLAVLFAITASLALAQPAPSRASNEATVATPPGLAEYRGHLIQLQELVVACRKQRSPQACDSSRVGSDDHVLWPSGAGTAEREIRYDWLRALMDRAGKQEAQVPTGNDATRGPTRTVDALLAAAHQRLVDDAGQAGRPPVASQDYAMERRSLAAILARREFQEATRTSTRDRFLNWLANWLNRIFDRLYAYGARDPWIGLLVRGLFLAIVCTGLIWALIRLERRSRVRLLENSPSFSGAPSAREWQLWLQDARSMANSELWREAIHFLYWAVIARLESRGLWPADRARTPREYLRLLASADPRREDLTALTRSFEHTWYGGREAGSAEYRAALSLAAELGVE